MRAIDADSLNNYKFGENLMASSYADGWDDAIDAIMKDAPTIDDRQEGEWIDYSDEGFVECPFCQCATNCDGNIDELHFCFNCGAKLTKENSNV